MNREVWTTVRRWGAAMILLGIAAGGARAQEGDRPRVRDVGIVVGVLPTGENNAITDVPGVRVGHATVVEGDSIRTGVTAVVPHEGDVFGEKVPAAIHVANGFGKLMGTTQVDELGTIETPILLTNTLAVGRVADALVAWTLNHTSEEGVRSVNPVVGETNDGFLNAITVPRVGPVEVEAALSAASSGTVAEGSVGAGTGTRALGFKGGMGTSSRRVRIGSSTYTVGALVQSNFGGLLEILGVPVGRALGKDRFLEYWVPPEGDGADEAGEPKPGPRVAFRPEDEPDSDGGSVMIVVATDAPLEARALERIAQRVPYAIGRVGGWSSHGSGDYVIAFSTASDVRVPYRSDSPLRTHETLRGEALGPLFLAAIEATEEAILNSLFRATSVDGHRGGVEAIPVDRVREILAGAGACRRGAGGSIEGEGR